MKRKEKGQDWYDVVASAEAAFPLMQAVTTLFLIEFILTCTSEEFQAIWEDITWDRVRRLQPVILQKHAAFPIPTQVTQAIRQEQHVPIEFFSFTRYAAVAGLYATLNILRDGWYRTTYNWQSMQLTATKARRPQDCNALLQGLVTRSLQVISSPQGQAIRRQNYQWIRSQLSRQQNPPISLREMTQQGNNPAVTELRRAVVTSWEPLSLPDSQQEMIAVALFAY